MVEQLDLIPQEGGGSIPTSPLQLIIKKTNLDTIKSGCKQWHYSGYCQPQNMLNFAVWFENRVVGVVQYGVPCGANRMTNGKITLELIRLALCPDCPKNSATRVMSVCEKIIKKVYPRYKYLVSYSDDSRHIGTIYKAGNFKNIGKTEGNDWTNRPGRERSKNLSKTVKTKWIKLL